MTLRLQVAISCFTALFGIIPATSGTSAAARELRPVAVVKPHLIQPHAVRNDARVLQHSALRTVAHTPQRQVETRAVHRGVGSVAHNVVHEVATEGAHSFGGMASYYSESQTVASGGTFNPNGLTCAHRSLPFGTHLRVADPSSGRSVDVIVNDRGPFVPGRVLDLSLAAARVLGMIGRGVMRVEAHVI